MTPFSTTLTCPVLVSQSKIDGKDQFLVKPLFFQYTTISHRRFEHAISRLKTTIQDALKGMEITHDTIDDVNWFRLNPKINYKIFKLNIPLKNKRTREGKFGMAIFNLQKMSIACLPHFNNFMFILEKNERGKFDPAGQAPEIISELLKRFEEENPEDFDFENFTSSPKEFVTPLELNLQLKKGTFGFTNDAITNLFDAFGGNQKMDGATEIWNIGKNLNHLYPASLNRAFYQETMVNRIHNLLFERPFKNSPIAIVGKQDIGKKTVVHEALRQYIELENNEDQPRNMWHIDPTRIITGMSIVGMWQKRMEAILAFIQNPYQANRGSDILLVDNAIAMLHIGKSRQNNMTVNDVFKPYLEKRHLQLIILATPEEWKIIQEKDRRFTDLFQLIRMEQPDLETSVKITLENRKVLEYNNDCIISVKAIQSIFDFRRNYLRRKALPGSVIKIMQQLAIKYKGKKIDVPEVRAEFETFTGLNEEIFDAPNPVERDEINYQISQNLIGQTKAVKTLANVIHTIKARLTSVDKPLGSFMFIGPTGVGKTQAAKVLSKYLTGYEDNLMQFDMNEFIDSTAVARLIGNAQNPEGQLTGKVRYQPFGIVLLDEIEKAHPKVLDLLLQILDDARLTDSLGRTIDFSNIIIIMTSNVGASQVGSQAGFKSANHDESSIYRKAVENKFRPEFINRIDEIVIFNPLEMHHILDIAWLQIKELLSRDGFVRRTTILNIEPKALEWVAQRGFNSRMGGRALKRQIEKDLTALTAAQLVSNYSTSPIHFEIFLEKNQLVPKISTLQFEKNLEEEWFPQLPDVTKGKGFYLQLIRSLEAIERQIERMDRKDQNDSAIIDFSKSYHYSFKEKIAESKERLTHLSLGFRDKKFQLELSNPLRLKRNNVWGNSENILKENVKDIFFQQEGLAEISDEYHRTNIQYNSIETEFLNSYLEVSFLKIFARDFLKNNTQKVTLRFESSVNNAGEKQIEQLCELYNKFLEFLNIEKEVDEKKQFIQMEGYGLTSLFKGEEGIHLFHLPNENPIPIRVIVEKENSRKKASSFTVIRVYDFPNTLTDFRTSFTNAINITAAEFSLLIYAGLPRNLRKNSISRR